MNGNRARDGDEGTGVDDRLATLADCLALKDEPRTGWQLRGVDDPESVAAHSWGVSLLCLVFADDAGVDTDEALRLAVVHDLAEARTGDFPTRVDATAGPVSPAEKERRERAAMAAFGAALPTVEALWETYERRESETARFVKDMDLVDMCLQALVYERERRYDEGEFDSDYARLDEFFATAEPRLSTDVGTELFERVRARYEQVRDGAAAPSERTTRSGDESVESDECDESDELDWQDESDESDELDGQDEPNESVGADESDELDESDESDEPDKSDEPRES